MKEEHSIFTGWAAQEKKRLGLENLFHKCFPGETYNGNIVHNFKCNNIKPSSSPSNGGCQSHEESFLLQLSVASCFVQPEYPKSDIVGHRQTLLHERATSQQFTIHLGSSCTKTMAKRLNEHNITIEMLKSVFEPEL